VLRTSILIKDPSKEKSLEFMQDSTFPQILQTLNVQNLKPKLSGLKIKLAAFMSKSFILIRLSCERGTAYPPLHPPHLFCLYISFPYPSHSQFTLYNHLSTRLPLPLLLIPLTRSCRLITLLLL